MPSDKKSTILLLSWRDITSPKMGGAEIFTHEMMRNTDLSELELIHFSPLYDGAKNYEIIEGITYIREGSLLTVIFKCMMYYKRNKDNIDFIIDQCNTFRFFTKFWVAPDKRIFLIFQLTREIWKYHMHFPLNMIGKWLETPMLKLNKDDLTITISESTGNDLLEVGFDKEKITIIPVGISFTPWDRQDFCDKEPIATFVYVGRFAKYKGIDACFYAFGEYKKKYRNTKLWIVGKKDDKYINDVLLPICTKYDLSYGNINSDADIVFHGFVSEKRKLELMSRAHLLLMPSIREGWGLIITEAAAVGTPGVVYNSPGLIDAVDFGRAGYITKHNNYHELYETMDNAMSDTAGYERILANAHDFSHRFNWKYTGKAFTDFIRNIQLRHNER